MSVEPGGGQDEGGVTQHSLLQRLLACQLSPWRPTAWRLTVPGTYTGPVAAPGHSTCSEGPCGCLAAAKPFPSAQPHLNACQPGRGCPSACLPGAAGAGRTEREQEGQEVDCSHAGRRQCGRRMHRGVKPFARRARRRCPSQVHKHASLCQRRWCSPSQVNLGCHCDS